MVTNALAVPAKPSSADTLRRFITASRAYLGLQPTDYLRSPIASESVDPIRFRFNLQSRVVRRHG